MILFPSSAVVLYGVLLRFTRNVVVAIVPRAQGPVPVALRGSDLDHGLTASVAGTKPAGYYL